MRSRFALGFAIYAAIGRVMLPDIHSRIHVFVFVLFALLLELVGKPIAGKRPSLAAFAANAGASVAAIVAVKWWLEGIRFTHWWRIFTILTHPFGGG